MAEDNRLATLPKACGTSAKRQSRVVPMVVPMGALLAGAGWRSRRVSP